MIAVLILLAQWPGIPDTPPSQFPPPVYQPYYQPANPYLEWQQQRDWAGSQRWEQQRFQQKLLEEMRRRERE